jgi:hypothetical protein
VSRRWLAAIVFLFIWSLTTHGKYSASGDEPHYLMITQSLVADGDLDLANNYANNDGRLFGHDGLTIGLHAVRTRSGRTLSIHDVGVGVVLVPVYVVARQIASVTSEALLRRFKMDRGLFTYSLVGLCLIALTTAGVVLLAAGLTQLAGTSRAMLVVLAAAVSPPIASHAFLVFPEVIALFVSCVVVWYSLKTPDTSDARMLLVVMLLIGALPWMHHKYLLYVPGLVFVVAWHRWPLIRAHPGTTGIAMLMFALPPIALLAWTWHEWGTFGGALTTEGVPFSMSALKAGAVGLWVDRQSGLLAYAPIYWVLPACVVLTWRRSWPFLLPAFLLYLPAAAFVIGWWAGFAPAARYLVPAMPLLLVPMAAALRFSTIRGALYGLGVFQAAIDIVVWQHPRALWPAPPGNPALALLGGAGRAYESALPAIQSRGVTMEAAWLCAAAAVASAVLVGRTIRN